MTLWRCEGCTTLYAVGLSRCPRCHSTAFHEEGSMPKITRNGGATNASAAKPPTPKAAPATTELVGEPGPELVRLEGGEQPSPGNSSSTSSTKQPKKSAPSGTRRRKPAPTTENPSPSGPTDASSASTTAGGPEATTSAPADDRKD